MLLWKVTPPSSLAILLYFTLSGVYYSALKDINHIEAELLSLSTTSSILPGHYFVIEILIQHTWKIQNSEHSVLNRSNAFPFKKCLRMDRIEPAGKEKPFNQLFVLVVHNHLMQNIAVHWPLVNLCRRRSARSGTSFWTDWKKLYTDRRKPMPSPGI